MRDALEMVADLATLRYPGFVYGRELRGRELPVFILHGVEPEAFGRLLRFLAANRYHTLTVSELEAFVRGHSPALPDRSIVLTFDDGMASVWTSAFPLLRKHGFRATVFLIPGKIREGGEPRPTLEDVLVGRARAEDVGDEDRGPEPLATWREIETMAAAGLIEFESHTLHHALVFTGPRLTGFVTPEALRRYHPFEFSFAHLFEDSNVGGVTPPPLGTPIYASSPRCAAERRFLDDPRLREACIGLVESQGGEAFFREDGWRSELPRFVGTWRAQHGSREHYETPEERHRALLRELRVSKERIEERLGRPVRHLCYPWGLGSELAARLSREVGYRTNLWAKVGGRLTNRRGDDPYRISRVGSDFLAVLPGEQRTTLARLIVGKLRRRAQGGSAYLSH
ncbi:MAG: polysaccharide deacetylase family protein [Gemmatimonadales bacterium]